MDRISFGIGVVFELTCNSYLLSRSFQFGLFTFANTSYVGCI